MTANTAEESKSQKRITQERVHAELKEKDDLFRDGVNYEDAY